MSISFDGFIKINGEEIGFESTRTEIEHWIERNKIEQVGPTDKGWSFYRLQDVLDPDTPIEVVLKVNSRRLQSIVLRRMHGLNPNESWEKVTINLLMQEFNFLIDLVKRLLKRDPDQRRPRECKWIEKWGEILVTVEPNSFEVAIFMDRKSAR